MRRILCLGTFFLLWAAACGTADEQPSAAVDIAHSEFAASGPDWKPQLCQSCGPERVGCIAGCTDAACEELCDKGYANCWELYQCDWLSDDCEGCVNGNESCRSTCEEEFESCNDCSGRGCNSGCSQELQDCRQTCDTYLEQCWALDDCDPRYIETTAVCTYLEGEGIDFSQQSQGTFSISPPGVRFLNDIDHIRLGLDIPATNCASNSITRPCADRSYSVDWSVDALSLSVNNVTFFHEEKDPTEQFLAFMTGGNADEGIHEWTKPNILTNPYWGLSQNDIGEFMAAIPLNNGTVAPVAADFLATAPTTISADWLALFVEGSVGTAISGFLKDGNETDGCRGQTFCDNRRKVDIDMRTGDCDFGNCTPGDDTASPGVEVRGVPAGAPTGVEVGVDLSISAGYRDGTDCYLDESPCWLDDEQGDRYTHIADYEMRINVQPLCPWVGTSTCSSMSNNCTGNQVCNINSGQTVGACQTRSIILRPVALPVLESGGIVGFAEHVAAMLQVLGLDVPGPTSFIEASINDMLSDMPIANNLSTCPNPLAFIDDAGNITLNVATTVSTGRTFASSQLVRWADIAESPGIAWSTMVSAFNQPIANITLGPGLPASVRNAIEGTRDPDGKMGFDPINRSLAKACALAAFVPATTLTPAQFVCDPTTNFNQIPLPPPDIDLQFALSCQPPGRTADLQNFWACEQLAQLKAFFMQPAVWNNCVASQPGATGTPEEQMEFVWQRYEQTLDACLAPKLRLQDILPVRSVELEITTGRDATSDTFPFVDLTSKEDLSGVDYETFKCRNRRAWELDAPEIDYGHCPGDPGDPAYFGQPGCRCKDIDVWEPLQILIDGGRPDGAGSHTAHGLLGTSQYCIDEQNSEVVCGKIDLVSDWPLCQRCGIDTNLGCSCDTTGQCQGKESNLRCVGSASEEGWPGGGAGTCLPDPNLPEGREALEEMPWFCLDNCDAIDGYGVSQGGCYYNQLDVQSAHGECFDVHGSCNGGISEQCPAEQRMMCKTVQSGPDICEAECGPNITTSCQDLGFPEHYVCDADSDAGFVPGHCVPQGCINYGSPVGFCELYR